MDETAITNIHADCVLVSKQEDAIREVIVTSGTTTHWLEYDKQDGKRTGDGDCSLSELAAWAGRFATREEIAVLQRPALLAEHHRR